MIQMFYSVLSAWQIVLTEIGRIIMAYFTELWANDYQPSFGNISWIIHDISQVKGIHGHPLTVFL